MPLVFLDESGFAFDLPRPSGYAPVGERCEGLQDWHAKGRLNVIAALLGTRLMAVTLFTGSIIETKINNSYKPQIRVRKEVTNKIGLRLEKTCQRIDLRV